jgi:hypothetical protein
MAGKHGDFCNATESRRYTTITTEVQPMARASRDEGLRSIEWSSTYTDLESFL